MAKSVFIIKLENRILRQIKRCQSAFSGKGVDVNLYLAYLGEIFEIFYRKYLPFFRYWHKNLCKQLLYQQKVDLQFEFFMI